MLTFLLLAAATLVVSACSSDGVEFGIPKSGSGSGTAILEDITYEFEVIACLLAPEREEAEIFGKGTTPDGRPFVIRIDWIEDTVDLVDEPDLEEVDTEDPGLEEPTFDFSLRTQVESLFDSPDEEFTNLAQYTSLNVDKDGFGLVATFDELYDFRGNVDILEPEGGVIEVNCKP